MESSPSLHTLSLLVVYLVWSVITVACSLLLAKCAIHGRRRFQVWRTCIIALLACWIALLFFPVLLSSTPSALLIPSAGYALTHVHAAALSKREFDLLARITPWALWLYVAGLVIFAARAALRLTWLRRVLKHAQPPSAKIQSIFDQARGFDRYRGCTIHVLPGLSSPATIGWLRPRILLPDFCAIKPDDNAIRQAMRHELKHIQRRDALWSSVAQLASIVLWFNPAIWVSLSRMQIEREFACDEELIADTPHNRRAYAECLVYFARNQSGGHVAPILNLTSPASFTHRRIVAILTLPTRSSISLRLARLIVGISTLVLLPLCLAALRFDFYRNASFFTSVLAHPIHVLTTPQHLRSRHNLSATAISSSRHEASVQKTARTASTAPDERLIAEHRSALDILTYSTMGDTPDSTAARENTLPEGRVGTENNFHLDVSWKSVAVSTAEVVAGAGRGHGHDDH